MVVEIALSVDSSYFITTPFIFALCISIFLQLCPDEAGHLSVKVYILIADNIISFYYASTLDFGDNDPLLTISSATKTAFKAAPRKS
jgi:hypothetical protein